MTDDEVDSIARYLPHEMNSVPIFDDDATDATTGFPTLDLAREHYMGQAGRSFASYVPWAGSNPNGWQARVPSCRRYHCRNGASPDLPKRKSSGSTPGDH